ncbi:hypothetical protein [Coleofasciculus sp.]|uniref:hypothetical protein n=1 Tax=Coleofasciculus sp. TaxID=3100458 RepID=UPI0039FAA34E
MTAQVPDTFYYNGEKYELVECDGEKFITPQDYGMYPDMLHTACHRGFVSTYEITNEGLFLKEMTIGEVIPRWKPIQGIMPRDDSWGSYTYEGLNLLTPFTGKIQLGKNLLIDPNAHMGYPPKIAYQTLLEFSFKQGKVTSVYDLSAINAKNRKNNRFFLEEFSIEE